MKILSKVFLLLILVTACDKDFTSIAPEVSIPDRPKKEVNASLVGQVLDDNLQVIEGATVIAAGYHTQTNERGFYIVPRQVLDANGTVVRVEKEGYFAGIDRVYPKANSHTFSPFILKTKDLAGTFTANTGAELDLAEGGKLRFDAKVIADQDGQAFEGQVNVYAQYMNPLDEHLGSIMPGDLVGMDIGGEERALISYGMWAIELEDNNGNPLNILDGEEAQLEFPIQMAQSGIAPEVIPLWSFNEDAGLWVEEGTATRVGDRYQASVTHFSFWNVDEAFPLIDFSMVLRNQNGQIVPNRLVRLAIDNGNVARYCWTDENGFVAGKVPANELIRVSVRTACEGFDETQDIGPFSENVDSLLINYDHPEEDRRVRIRGKIVDCEENNLPDAVVEGVSTTFTAIDDFGNTAIAVTDENGDYELSMIPCENDSIFVRGYDVENRRESPRVKLNTFEEELIDVEDLQVCDLEISSFMELTIDSVDYLLPTIEMGYYSFTIDSFNIVVADSLLGFLARVPLGDSLLVAFVGVEDLGEGLQNEPAAKFALGYFEEFDASGLNIGFSSCNILNECRTMSVNITQSGAIGAPIELTFEGSAEPVIGYREEDIITISGRLVIPRAF